MPRSCDRDGRPWLGAATQSSSNIEVSLNRLLKIVIAVAIVIAVPKIVQKVMLPGRGL